MSINFEKMIRIMQEFWSQKGCVILPSMDTEMGAATYHPYMLFGAKSNGQLVQGLNGDGESNVQFVQKSRRPQDGRAGVHPHRLYTHHQFQVVFDDVPHEIERYVRECFALLNLEDSDLRFVEDNWNNPTLGAAGLGWEVRCNEMEILQYTYFQQIASKPCIKAELAYGLERLALQVQKKSNVYDLQWSDSMTYGDLFMQAEVENTRELELYDVEDLVNLFEMYKKYAQRFLTNLLPYAGYQYASKMSHIFNLLDAKGALSHSQKNVYVQQIRGLVAQVMSKASVSDVEGR